MRSAKPDSVAEALPEIVRRADGGVSVSDVGTGASLAEIGNVPLQIVAGLTGTLGVVALLLAMSGLDGLLSCIVDSRRRELGVRRAIGASNAAVWRLVFRDGLRPVLSGLVAGMAAGGAIRFAVGRLLRGVPLPDWWLFLALPALFLAAGLLACLIPAWRATRVEPAQALRAL